MDCESDGGGERPWAVVEASHTLISRVGTLCGPRVDNMACVDMARRNGVVKRQSRRSGLWKFDYETPLFLVISPCVRLPHKGVQKIRTAENMEEINRKEQATHDTPHHTEHTVQHTHIQHNTPQRDTRQRTRHTTYRTHALTDTKILTLTRTPLLSYTVTLVEFCEFQSDEFKEAAAEATVVFRMVQMFRHLSMTRANELTKSHCSLSWIKTTVRKIMLPQ